MAVRRAVRERNSETPATNELIERKVIAFAEQLGSLMGTVQAKAEGWLDRKALSKEISRIRDGAAALLDQVNFEGTAAATSASRETGSTRASRLSRGPVDAPGKRHRKPLPREPIRKRMGEPTGKQMGQKSAKNARRGRG